jgi:hypothetical protein
MTADAVWIDLVKFGGKTSMLSVAFKGKDVDTGHQGMTGRMALRTIDLGVHGRLFPERGFTLLMMTGDTEFLLGRRIGGQCNGGIHTQYDENAP